MIRGDREITTQIMAELRWDPGVAAEHITVLSSRGGVVLSGFVESYCDWWTAGRIASQVNGVRAVDNRIEVRLPPFAIRPDDKILADCVRVLDESALGPVNPVQVRVAQGWVSLEGQVEVAFLAARAERAVRGVVGIRGVANRVAVGRRSGLSAPPKRRPGDASPGVGSPARRPDSSLTWDRRPPRP